VNIPIFSPSEVISRATGNLVIFPWNIAEEICKEINSEFPNFSGEIWVALPKMRRLK
jgi:hypothetical protein